MTLISDMAASIVSKGLATALGTDIFGFRFPSSPLNCICIIPAGGREPDLYDSSGAIDRPGMQVQVRNTDVLAAEASAEAIRRGLDLATISGYVICRTTRSRPVDVTSPDDLKADDGPAYRFSVDFILSEVRI